MGKILIHEKDESKRNGIRDDVNKKQQEKEALKEEGGRKIQSKGLTVVEIRGRGAR